MATITSPAVRASRSSSPAPLKIVKLNKEETKENEGNEVKNVDVHADGMPPKKAVQTISTTPISSGNRLTCVKATYLAAKMRLPSPSRRQWVAGMMVVGTFVSLLALVSMVVRSQGAMPFPDSTVAVVVAKAHAVGAWFGGIVERIASAEHSTSLAFFVANVFTSVLGLVGWAVISGWRAALREVAEKEE